MTKNLKYLSLTIFASAISALIPFAIIEWHGQGVYGEYVKFFAPVYFVSSFLGFGSHYLVQRQISKNIVNMTLLASVGILAIVVSILSSLFSFTVLQGLFIFVCFFNNFFIDFFLIAARAHVPAASFRCLFHLVRIVIIYNFKFESLFWYLVIVELVFMAITVGYITKFLKFKYVHNRIRKADFLSMGHYYGGTISGAVISANFLVTAFGRSLDGATLGGLYLVINLFQTGFNLVSVISKFEQINVATYLRDSKTEFFKFIGFYECLIVLTIFSGTLGVSWFYNIKINLAIFILMGLGALLGSTIKLVTFWFYQPNHSHHLLNVGLLSAVIFVLSTMFLNYIVPLETALPISAVCLFFCRPIVFLLYRGDLRKAWFIATVHAFSTKRDVNQ